MLKSRRERPQLRWFVLSAACFLFSAGAAYRYIPSLGETVCSPRDRVVSGLDRLFGEIPRARAVSGDDSVVEFFSSRENGTWTLLRSLPDGRACVVATGNGDWDSKGAELRETSYEI
ncbi:hypothetical protein [Aliiruegeria sabulilitoris]|uniref:hypothetical protein n=1 Tax=Aliiruegeria sabulilitoris TaxID=1510458 RepID=UPI00082B4E42|nr:hypothetical protein [Aliiruegeria sabulilitoris]NDR58948.1 hypothetical protein [Pseudoruegeria sp. M32A2M]